MFTLLLSTQLAAFAPGAAPRVTAETKRATSPAALLDQLPDHLEWGTSLLAELVDPDGERIYGAVDAPFWIAPVAGVGAIITAALPAVLAPGEDAFNKQQKDEATVNKRGQFGGFQQKNKK